MLEHVPRRRAVTVTASPSKGLEATLVLAERLAKHGYVAVPHLAARMIRDRAELSRSATGWPAGHHPGLRARRRRRTRPGDYPDAFSLLEDLAGSGSPFTHVGITGYPESHPKINDDLTVQAMWDKRRHATHVVSNLTFDPARSRAGSAGCAAAGSRCRCCSACPARSTAPSCSRWPPRSASGSRPASWPSTRAPSPASPPRAASPASSSSRSAPASPRSPSR